MSVTHARVGAPTQSSFQVRAKVTGASARLFVDTDAALATPVYTSPLVTAVDGMVALNAVGLAASTQYYWGIEEGGVLSATWQGRAKTHPVVGLPASYTLAISSCAGLDTTPDTAGQVITSAVSNHPVFTTIRNFNPLMFLHLGDENYRNRTTNDVSLFRTDDSDVLTYNGTIAAGSRQGLLVSNVCTLNLFDDHDFGGNNSDGTSPTRPAVNTVYRERKPAYALADEGIYQAFQIGRVLYIAADTRTFRSPNSQAQSPAKTMLGIAQKEWMRQILANSDAKALVWLMPTPWLGTGSDKWVGFRDERAEMAAMFAELGWTDRMISVTGDRHANAFASAAANEVGGFPEMMFGSLDSAGSGADAQYDIGMNAGNNRWGQLSVDDNGERIILNGTGMTGGNVWRSYALSIETPVDSGPGTVIPPAPEAREQRSVTWLAVNALDGSVLDEVPLVEGAFGRSLCAATSTSLSVPLLDPGSYGYRPGLLELLIPRRTALVPIVHDVPQWQGTIMQDLGGDETKFTFSAVGDEAYFERRKVRDHVFRQVDQALIAAALIADAGPIPGVGPAPIMVIDAPLTGIKRDRTYLATDRQTVADALRELATVENGIEWTISLRWADTSQTRLVRVVEVKQRLGTAFERPDIAYVTGGSAAPKWTYSRDHSDGKAGNVVQAYASGEGDAQPASDLTYPPDLFFLGEPIYEHHFQPSSSITLKETLNAHARAELARIRDGLKTWQVSVLWDRYPRIGVDWHLGDDIDLNLWGPRFPNGVRAIVRPIGFSNLNPSGGRMNLILQGEEVST